MENNQKNKTELNTQSTTSTPETKKSPKVKVCEICQRSNFLSEETIRQVLADHSNCIEKYAYILHDKDIDENGNPVSPHFHIILKFNKDDGRTLKHVSSWFGIEEQYVSKSTSKSKNKYQDMCKYLIHMGKEDKHQYDPSLVHANFDYNNFITQTTRAKRKQEIIDLIMAGTITPLNFTTLISPSDYDTFKRSINNAFEYKKNMDMSIERHMDVIYIYGTSGTGKTTFAKHISQQRNLTTFISGSGNDFLDGYTQEECIILDDFRGENLNFSEILKLLDNFNNSSVASRYANCDIGHCKLLIITSVFDIDFFYQYTCPSGMEPILQLKRRCGTYMHVERDIIHVYRFDSTLQDYSFVGDCLNPLEDFLQAQPASPTFTDDELLTSLGLSRKPILPNPQNANNDSDDDSENLCPF